MPVFFHRFLAVLICLIITASGSAPADCGHEADCCLAPPVGGVVVSACPIASKVGGSVLESGGNVVDAAVAVGFALAVTYPSAGNLGGGGFMLLRFDTGDFDFIDFRERAPAAATEGMFLDEDGEIVENMSTMGHRAAGVPGSVAGLHEAHRLYGVLDWRELLEPAIMVASGGFPVSGQLALSLEKLLPYMDSYEGLRKFTRGDGSLLEEGDTLRQPALARTLERIAGKGTQDFYFGETAGLIIDEMHRGGGLITDEDLGDYEVARREPVRGEYRGYGIVSAPPPSSGGIVLLELLNILEGFDLSKSGFFSDEAVHLTVEAERRAFFDRAMYLGDPDFVDMPVSTLILKDYANHLRLSIGYEASLSEHAGKSVEPVQETTETTREFNFETQRYN